MREIVEFEPEIRRAALTDAAVLRRAKQLGFATRGSRGSTGTREGEVRARRLSQGIRATFKTVDTCAAEFVAHTPYLYSTYEEETRRRRRTGGKSSSSARDPTASARASSSDYCCVHAAYALKERNIEAIMINCNPETVSTDYDTSDRLYFGTSHARGRAERRREGAGPSASSCSSAARRRSQLAVPLQQAGVPILGTSPDAIDRRRGPPALQRAHHELALEPGGRGHRALAAEARGVAQRLGYPGSSRRRTCWAAARCASCTTTRT